MAKTTSAKCGCKPAYILGALILFSLGLWSLIQGIWFQWNASNYTTVLPWYFLGFLLMGIGKMLKWESCSSCAAHGMK